MIPSVTWLSVQQAADYCGVDHIEMYQKMPRNLEIRRMSMRCVTPYVVIALGTAEDDTMARLRASEATSLVLLTATALGLASCPITEPLEVAETRAAVQADVFGEEAYPQMLLRIGWAPVNADPLPSTPRRDLSEVVTRLDGSPLGGRLMPTW